MIDSTAIKLFSAIFFVTTFNLAVAQEQQNNSSTNTGLIITTDGVTNNASDESQSNLGSAYVCSLNGIQRRIEIDLLNAPAPVPCEVNYYKDNEDESLKETLWTANNDRFYCENQARVLMEKLEAMSWECSGKL